MVKDVRMTVEEALNILRSGDTLHADEARAFLQENHPDVLAEYENSLKKEVAEDPEAEKVESREPAAYEEEVDAVEVIAQNHKDLQELSNNYDMGKKSVQQYMGKIVDRVEIYEEGQKDPLTKERKNDYLKLLFAESKLKVEQELVGSKAFYKADKKAKKEIFESAVDDCVLADLYCVHAASSAEMPKEEIKVGGKKFFEYVKEQADNFRHLFDKTIDTKDEIKIKADAILIAVADAAEKTKTFAEKLRESARSLKEDARQKLNTVAVHFMSRKNRLEERASKLSVRYKEQIKPMVKAFGKQAKDSFKANKYQMGVDMLATFALSAAGFAAAPLALYGGFMMARPWIAPIWSEARMMKIKAKKEGKKLGLVERWRAAREKVKGTEKYKRKGWMTTALSAAVFVPLTAAAIASGGALPILGAAALMPVIKAGIANLVQGNELAHAYSAYSKKKDDENLKKQVKCEALGLGLGILASAAGQTLGHYSSAISEKLGGISEKVQGLFGRGGSNASAGVAAHAVSGNGSQVWDPEGHLSGENNEWGFDGGMYQPGQGDVVDGGAVNGGEVRESAGSFFPREWDESMGISKEEYLANLRKEKNVDEYFQYYHARLHDENIVSHNAYAHALMKAHELLDYLPKGTTEEQVVTQYFGLFGHYRYSGVNLVAGQPLSLGAFSNHDQEMVELYNFLFCDGKVSDVHKGAIDHLMNAEEYMRAHSDPNNHNVITKFVQDCHGVGRGSRWAGGHGVVEKQVEPPVIKDDIVIEDEPIVVEDPKPVEDNFKPQPMMRKVEPPVEAPKAGPEVREINTTDYLSVLRGEKMPVERDITGTATGNAFLKSIEKDR